MGFPSLPSLLTHSCDGRRNPFIVTRNETVTPAANGFQLIVHNSKTDLWKLKQLVSYSVTNITHPSEVGNGEESDTWGLNSTNISH